jgi:prevent-host-death family protein
MPTILPVTELHDHLGTILDQAAQAQEPVYVTRHGRTQVVLLSVALYEALLCRSRSEAPGDDWYQVSQASLARIWEHPDESVYTVADGEPV